jgi:hypothetical protein
MPTGSLHRAALRRHLAVTLACTAALTLAACQRSPPPPSNATPDKAIATNLRLTAAGDFDGLMQNRLPPAIYTAWRHEWDAAHAHATPVSATQQQQFAAIMQQLTAPGAEAKLLQRAEPTLATLKGGHNTLPIASSILEAAGRQVIAESPQLGPAQRVLALQGLDALIAWANTTAFSNPKNARKAVDLICTTARALHVQTFAQWRALDYAATMKNYGIIWNGLEGLMNLYGLDLAKSLTDAKVDTVTHDGPHAMVKLQLQLAGQPLAASWPMLEQDSHWYDGAMLSAWAKAHPASAATAAAPASAGSATVPAPAQSVAAPAAST